MSNTDVTIKTTLAERIADRLAGLLPIKDHSQVVRVDATRHRFVKRSGGIWVELNPLREDACGQRYREIVRARDDRVNNAGAVRDAGLKAAKAEYELRVAEIEKMHRETADVATREFKAAEQALLNEFAMPPADVAKVEG